LAGNANVFPKGNPERIVNPATIAGFAHPNSAPRAWGTKSIPVPQVQFHINRCRSLAIYKHPNSGLPVTFPFSTEPHMGQTSASEVFKQYRFLVTIKGG
jgi:hypothetical protein